MSLADDLTSHWPRRAAGLTGELALFRALVDVLNASSGVVAEEHHGTRSHVRFAALRGAGRGSVRCELADVLLITFAARRRSSARLTWLQAKVTELPLHDRVVGNAHADEVRFGANLEQWDLLRNRPVIHPATKRFVPPPDLLSAAVLASVGSFGVFYPDDFGHNMAYFVADELKPFSNNHGRSGILVASPGKQVRTINGFRELTSACCLYIFAEGIERELVGTPMDPLLTLGAPSQVATRRAWFGAVLDSLAAPGRGSRLAAELRELLELPRSAGEPAFKLEIPARTLVLVRHQGEGPG